MSSGIATLNKKNLNNLNKSKKIPDRKLTLKNLYRKIIQIKK